MLSMNELELHNSVKSYIKLKKPAKGYTHFWLWKLCKTALNM